MAKKEDIGWKFPAIVFIGVVVIWIGSLILLKDFEKRGTFGDMFGAVNSLFSGLAFAGIIIAILLQKRELSLQRKELELTRNELRGQKNQMEIQNKTLLKQNF